MLNHAKYQEFVKSHLDQEFIVLGEKFTFKPDTVDREYDLEEIVNVFNALGYKGVCCNYDKHNAKWLVMHHKSSSDTLCIISEGFLGVVLDSIEDKSTAVTIANSMNSNYQRWASANDVELDEWIRSDYTEEDLV